MRCRLLPYESADGARNMATDHVLLDAIDAEPDQAVLRTYGWAEPTLSLGYFQAAATARLDPRWANVPVVRRPTGGGALWHHREITYALIVPRSLSMARRPSELYRAVHGAIAEALRGLGFAVSRRGESTDTRSRPFLCFLDQDPEDILLDGHKIVGSAQRRRPRAVLQHGSLLLAHSERTPKLLGLRDLTDFSDDPKTLIDSIRQSITESLGLRPAAATLSDLQRNQIKALRESIYLSPDWTEKR